MSGPIVIPLELMLAIGFGIDIVLAILGINVFKIVKRKIMKHKFVRTVSKVQ